MRKSFVIQTLVLLAGLSISVTSTQAASRMKGEMPKLSPIRIERASVLVPGEVAVDAGLAFEIGREFGNAEYDNFRLAPLGGRFGIADSFEVGGYLGFSSNDQDDLGAPDDSGLEGFTVFGKLRLNEYAALQVGLTLGGDDDIAPYPNDGISVFGNLALQKPMPTGLIYGEFGYTAQGGDFDNSQYLNYGLGYALPLASSINLNFELTGEEAHIGTQANTLDMLVGANFTLTQNVRLAPYVTVGLFDASPDFSIGTAFEVRF